jgi:flagellar protein FliT
MDPWSELLARATAERELAAAGRWDELAASTAERVRLAAALGPAPAHARPLLEALASAQGELTATLRDARDRTARELAELGRGRGAVAAYGHAARRWQWIDDRA